MVSWMLAVIVACNIQLVHKTKSSQLNYQDNMFAIFSSSNLLNIALQTERNGLSTNCILSPYSQVTKQLLVDSSFSCQTQQYAFRSSTSSESWQKTKINPVLRYIRTLRWTPIPLGLGFALIAYQQFRHVKKRETAKIASASDPSELLAPNLYVSLYTMLPLRATSRFWGWVHNIDLPRPIRKPLLNFFVSTYGCNLKEAVVEDITEYKNLGEFFRRQLKKEVRPIHPCDCVVSPSDGQILHFGTVENGLVEQVKGVTYSLKSFLGLSNGENEVEATDEGCQRKLLQHEGNVLYHCVIYLAPGDYHKFHSPARWTVKHRRHIHGELMSVRPGFVNWIGGLFSLNERVVYTGDWRHGFFSLTAVGATNVGSIGVFFDDALHTNRKKCKKGSCEERHFEPPVTLIEKGEPFGEFNLGSTIVVIFEAPKGINFNVTNGQKIKYGELIGLCNCHNASS
ncbi:LOW QUALITY PROTEIN: phosphatidylserine decarboxylase proenzyme, mitochondrial-like [Uloborus diversus]|uniref:LOW QUALITY PROTEIN: phosphatidylserine decarboxylase proenzyme, mitochondrial-like n=1 Tax=Uloborus diversus TaxID=327109 RepID=UPI002409E940|nr:LOW QUALITY PROTEIN: phosphatidylserine decarboxylase proenzyme, mitochondrial-like [Uloborus diversus]